MSESPNARSEAAPNDLPFRREGGGDHRRGRGQGRSHALELARLGADVAVCDLGHDLSTVGYPLSTPADLAETARLVEDRGRRCLSRVADVRELDAMTSFVDEAVDALGSVDILVANAGVSTLGSICTMDATQWSETVDTNLTGVFNAMRAVAPHMRRQRWGRIVGDLFDDGSIVQPGHRCVCGLEVGSDRPVQVGRIRTRRVRGDRQRHRPGKRVDPDDPQRSASTR